MSNKIAYTDKMLATIFRMKETTVQLALQTFQQFGMVDIIDGVITIPKWDKHQSLDAYEKKKERDRIYQAERRASQRAIVEKSSDSKTIKSSYVAVSEEEREEEKEEEREKESSNNISLYIESDDEPQKPDVLTSDFRTFGRYYHEKFRKENNNE